MATAVTPLGEVKGVDLEGCERYAGIRYAKAPVGDLRFRAPVPVDAWDGVYDATAFGPAAPQMKPAPGMVGAARDTNFDEDCLFLNVWTPSADDGARPVMVWIHGGAYAIGSGDIYDGASLCTRGDVVVVTLNYRLGMLGWMGLDHLDPELAGSGNNGIRDQIEALRWVRANIAAFGGDPNNVTIFGESAGGGSVSGVMCAPEADGLYHKAIIESGAVGTLEPVGQVDFVKTVLAALGQPDGGIAALRAATPEQLVDAATAAGAIDKLGTAVDRPVDGTGAGFHQVVDGVVITCSFVDTIRAKADQNVPLIIGTNADEGTLFGMLLPQNVAEADVVIGPTAGDPAAVIAATKAAATGHPLLVDLMTDGVFRIPALRAADTQAETNVPVWVYLFTWKTPVFGGLLGATHALELPFVWGMANDPTWAFIVGDNPPTHLVDAMQDAWLTFAHTGNPNHEGAAPWPVYDPATRETMEFGDTVQVVLDPGAALRAAWYA